MSKGNTKTNKRSKNVNKPRSSRGGGFLLYILIIALIVTLAALGYLAWQYNNSQAEKANLDKLIAEERLLVGQLSNDLPKAVSGDLEMMGKVEKDAQRISDLIQGQKARAAEQGHAEEVSAISNKWKELTNLQADVMSKESAVSGVAFFIPEALAHSETITQKLKVIKKGLMRKESSNRLLNATERLSDMMIEVDKSMLQLETGVLQMPSAQVVEGFPGLVDQFKGAKSAMLQIANNSKDDPEVMGMANALLGSVSDLDSYEAYTSDIASFLNDFVGAKQGLSSYQAKSSELEADLVAHGEEGHEMSSGMFGLDWITLLQILAILAFLLLLAIMFVIISGQARASREAKKSQIDAETRTKNDQEAILRLMDDLADLSDGDLTVEAQVTEDFTGAIADSVNFTVESMREMVGTIIESSTQIESATEDTKQISALMEKASLEQSRRINESSSTTRTMSQSLNDIAENTDSSVEIARASVEIAKDGRNRVRQTIENMNNLRENIQTTSKRIKRLGESSQEIGDIVEIIKGIADQTNVLALNAAIQATGAGEAGRGFAVVADEVQQLAERSSNASKRIETIVKTIQTDASEAVASMEESTRQVVASANVTEEAGVSLDKIENVSQSLAKLIVNVSQETKKAADMANYVSDSMLSLTELNQATTRDVERAVESVDNLRELSGTLKGSVSGFKLPS